MNIFKNKKSWDKTIDHKGAMMEEKCRNTAYLQTKVRFHESATLHSPQVLRPACKSTEILRIKRQGKNVSLVMQLRIIVSLFTQFQSK